MIKWLFTSLALLAVFSFGVAVLFSSVTPFWAIVAIIAFIVTGKGGS